MTNYADSSNVNTLLGTINETETEDQEALITYALGNADNWINSHTDNHVFTSVPDLIQQAAEYKTVAIVLRSLNDTSLEESPTIAWYESEAKNYLNSWLAQNEEVDTDTHPYSSSQTPNGSYLRHTDWVNTDAPARSELETRINKRKILNNDSGTW